VSISSVPGARRSSARALPVPEIALHRFELSCGAKLLVSPRSGAPVTAMRVHLKGGPGLDPAGKEGLATLVGSLADQGTLAHSDVQLAELLEPAGGSVRGDASGLTATVAGGAWRLLADIACEVLMTAAFPDDLIGTQLARVKSRMEIDEHEPRAQAAQRFRKLVYGKHWLGRPARGTVKSIATITPDDLRAHHAEYWVASRATIVVCGDVNPQTVRRHLEKALARWTPGEVTPRKVGKFPERRTRVASFFSKREQVHLFLGHLGIRRKDPDYVPLVLLDHVLGTGPGFTNRISRRLRDELGLAYTVFADQYSSAGINPGTFRAYIGTSPEHAETSVAGFLEEMRRIRTELVSEAELETARSYLLGSYPLGFERAASRAAFLVSAEIHGFSEGHLERLLASFAEVTREDILRVAQEKLFPDDAVLASGGPLRKPQLEAALTASSPGK